MREIELENIVLTKGESSDLYEITSSESLKDYSAKVRISDSSGIKKEFDLEKTKKVLNDDSILNDEIAYTLTFKKIEFLEDIEEVNFKAELENFKHEVQKLEKNSMNESVTITGLVYREVEKEVQVPLVPDSPEAGSRSELKIVKEPLPNVEVSVVFASKDKEISRENKIVTKEDGIFSIEVFLGNTIKVEENNGFIFQIPSSITEALDKGRYFLTLTITKKELDGTISFQKEIIQTKLDINEKL